MDKSRKIKKTTIKRYFSINLAFEIYFNQFYKNKLVLENESKNEQLLQK